MYPPSKYSDNLARDLIYGCWCKGKRIANQKFPPITLLYIATILKNEGHDVHLLESQAEKLSHEDARKRINHIKPDVIVYPTSTMTIREDADVMKDYKADTGAVILAFGSHITFEPKQALDIGGMDFGVMKEAEYIIRDVVNGLEIKQDIKKIKGLCYTKGGQLKINEPYPYIRNLDELPFPDRDYIKNFTYFSPLVLKMPWTTAITSRGCPGRCTFCTSPAYYGRVLRFRSADNVVDEMEYLKKQGYNEIFYRDETFTAHPQRLNDICAEILTRKLDISWVCNARIGNLNKENLQLMKKAGCHYIKIGVESGVQSILDIVKKDIQITETIKTFELMNQVGINSHAHMILGCPGETKETIRKTLDFVKRINPTTITYNTFIAFPGTPHFDKIKQLHPEADGTKHDASKEHDVGYYSKMFCDLDDKEVGKAVKDAYKEFYLRPAYFLQTLKRIKSLNEFRRIATAGLEVLSYSTGKKTAPAIDED